MTYNPKTLQDLGSFWVKQGGANLGVVGNKAHTRGYHLGKDRIYSAAGDGDKDYSIRLARDRAGLTNAASAIDLGRLNGSLKSLRAFSRWLVEECRKDAAVRRDIREIIYTPDGEVVQRYSGVDNKIHTGPGNGDLSHLTHTHISFFRDSEYRDKRPLFAPYFVEIPDTSTEEVMQSFPIPEAPMVAVVKSGAWLYLTSDLKPNSSNVQLSSERALPYIGKVVGGGDVWIVGYDRNEDKPWQTAMFVRQADVIRTGPATSECDDALAELDVLKSQTIPHYQARIKGMREKANALAADLADD